MYGGILRLHTYKMNYVNTQHNYVDMEHNIVDTRDNTEAHLGPIKK